MDDLLLETGDHLLLESGDLLLLEQQASALSILIAFYHYQHHLGSMAG